jgi:hypothetical protein
LTSPAHSLYLQCRISDSSRSLSASPTPPALHVAAGNCWPSTLRSSYPIPRPWTDRCEGCWQCEPPLAYRPKMCLCSAPAPQKMALTCWQIGFAVRSNASCCCLQRAPLGVRLEMPSSDVALEGEGHSRTQSFDEVLVAEEPFHDEGVPAEKQYVQHPSQAPRHLPGPGGSVHSD